MEATNQIVAAVVSPRTASPRRIIAPAPKKPMPDTICAAMRAESVPGMIPIFKEKMVKSVEPTQISVFVLKPAGLSYSSLYQPMNPPKTRANKSLTRSSAVTCMVFNNARFSDPSKKHVSNLLYKPKLVLGDELSRINPRSSLSTAPDDYRRGR